MADEVGDIAETFPAKLPRDQCPGVEPAMTPSASAMPKLSLRLLRTTASAARGYGLRRDEGQRFHAAAVGGEVGFLQGVRVFGQVAEMAADIPAADYDDADGEPPRMLSG